MNPARLRRITEGLVAVDSLIKRLRPQKCGGINRDVNGDAVARDQRCPGGNRDALDKIVMNGRLMNGRRAEIKSSHSLMYISQVAGTSASR